MSVRTCGNRPSAAGPRFRWNRGTSPRRRYAAVEAGRRNPGMRPNRVDVGRLRRNATRRLSALVELLVGTTRPHGRALRTIIDASLDPRFVAVTAARDSSLREEHRVMSGRDHSLPRTRCRFTPLARTLRRRTRIYGRHREVRGVADAARDPGSKTRRGGGGDHRLAIGSEMHETTAGRGPGTHVRLAALASGNRSHAGDCNRRGPRTSRSDPARAPVSMGAAPGRTRSLRASQARASFPTSPARRHAAAIG